MTTVDNKDIVKRWLLKELNGTISEEEKSDLQTWINASAENEALAQRIRSARFLKQAILDRNENKQKHTWKALAHQISYVNFLHIGRWAKMAAVIIVLLACGWMFTFYMQRYLDSKVANITIPAGATKAILYDYLNDSVYRLPETAGFVFDLDQYNRLKKTQENDNEGNACRRIVVPRGGEYLIHLSDGTSVHLGPESAIDIPVAYSAENRNVKISGQAYMDVHTDSVHPFHIHTSNVEICVTGTLLNIEAYSDASCTFVSLERGKVELHAGAASFTLPVGRTASIGKGQQITLTSDSLAEHISWHNSRLVFYNRSMKEIMTQLSRWYDISVEFGDEQTAQSHITMDVSKYETFNQLSNDIEKMNELQFKIRKGNRVLITEKNLDQ